MTFDYVLRSTTRKSEFQNQVGFDLHLMASEKYRLMEEGTSLMNKISSVSRDIEKAGKEFPLHFVCLHMP